MLDGIIEIFYDYKGMLKKLKKKQYKERTEFFRSEYGHYFDEMMQSIDASDDKTSKMKEISELVCNEVIKKYKKFGKVPGFIKIDLSFFVIFFIFPTILSYEKDYKEEFADVFRTTWNDMLGEKINSVADYDTLHGSFNEKMFGMF